MVLISGLQEFCSCGGIQDARSVDGQVEGFKPYNGGEELRRAIAALAGSSTAQDREVEPQVLERLSSNICLKARLHLLGAKERYQSPL